MIRIIVPVVEIRMDESHAFSHLALLRQGAPAN